MTIQYKKVYLEIREDIEGMLCKEQRWKNMTDEQIKEVVKHFDDVNTSPIEDKLQAMIKELEDELETLIKQAGEK